MKTLSIALIILAILGTSLIICSIYAKKLGIDLKEISPKEIPLPMWLIAMVSTVILCALGTVLLMNSMQIEYNAVNGLFFGLGAIVIGLIFDFLVLAPHKNGLIILSEYLRHPLYWTTYLCVVITCVLIGFFGRIIGS